MLFCLRAEVGLSQTQRMHGWRFTASSRPRIDVQPGDSKHMANIPLLSAVQVFMGRCHGQFIDGQAVAESIAETIQVVNPSNKEVIAVVHKATGAQIEQAVVSARDAFESSWQKTSPAR